MSPRALSSIQYDLEFRLDAQARIKQFGPTPVNPFRELRSVTKQSLVALAQVSNMDKKAIYRLELGMYTNPLPSAVRYWVEVRSLISEGELWNRYEDYQLLQRQRHRLFLGDQLNSLVIDEANGLHPFRQLRQKRPSLVSGEPLPVGITDLCIALCLPLDTIQFWEKKWRNQQSVPKTVKAALSQIGYNRFQISTFEAQYKSWRLLHKTVELVGV